MAIETAINGAVQAAAPKRLWCMYRVVSGGVRVNSFVVVEFLNQTLSLHLATIERQFIARAVRVYNAGGNAAAAVAVTPGGESGVARLLS